MRPSLPLLPLQPFDMYSHSHSHNHNHNHSHNDNHTHSNTSSPCSSTLSSPSSSSSSLSLSLSLSSPRRPPTLPRRTSPTWRSVIVRNTAPRLNADVVGVALLAAEAKRKGGLMMRERRYVGAQGEHATSLSRRRVDLLEQDVRALLRTVAKAKARVKNQLQHQQCGNTSPRSIITKR